MQVAGWKKTRFETRDGETIQGYNVYLVDHDENVHGVLTDKVFISAEKAKACGFVPEEGQNVRLNFNRYGKIQSIDVLPNA